MDITNLDHLCEFYERKLLDDVAPFWLKNGVDAEHGGYLTCLNRDGLVYDYDKLCSWNSGRMIWFFSMLHNQVEPRKEWYEAARSGVDFIRRHGFDGDGRLYYSLTRDGHPLESPADVFSELFLALGLGEFSAIHSDETLYQEAKELMTRAWKWIETNDPILQPYVAVTRRIRRHGPFLIALNVAQSLRERKDEAVWTAIIDRCVHEILERFADRERRFVHEAVAVDGSSLPGFMGRWTNPGHMIEGGIFIIREGRHRGDQSLIHRGVELVDWGFEWGWDSEFGGIRNDVDVDGLPTPWVEAYRYDCKLWWQHAEALHGSLLAHAVTGDSRYLELYRKTHEYSFSKFADDENGEWIALLDRRGEPLNHCKGTSRKSAYHVGRNFNWNRVLLNEKMDGA